MVLATFLLLQVKECLFRLKVGMVRERFSLRSRALALGWMLGALTPNRSSRVQASMHDWVHMRACARAHTHTHPIHALLCKDTAVYMLLLSLLPSLFSFSSNLGFFPVPGT